MRVVAVLVALLTALLTGCSNGPKAPPAAVAKVVSEQPAGQRLVDLTVESPALGRTAKVRLLTPDGWEQRAGKTWPALYLLHGCCDTYDKWTSQTDVRSIPELRNVLVVMPEGGLVGWYSDWWNHGKSGAPAWEQFHLTELRKILEHDYGAGPQSVIAGLSMGGLGALLYAAHNQGMFRAAASFSGVVHPLFDGFPEGLAQTQQAYGEDPLALWGDSVAQRAIWEQHDPYYLANRLRAIPLFMSAGNGKAGPFDVPGTNDDMEAMLGQMNRVTAERFQQAGLDVQTDFYGPGTHTWPYWQRELHKALPMLLAALKQ